jgi:hypothetical protein
MYVAMTHPAWQASTVLMVVLLAGCGDGDDDSAGDAIGGTSESISSPSEVPAEAKGAYFVGYEFSGFPLAGVLVPPNGAGNSTSFIYGDCEPSGDSGCAPPLELQTWSICDRHPNDEARSRLTSLRGAKADFAPGESRVEIYTDSKSVVIFSDVAGLAERAAKNVEPFATPRTSSDLTPPNARALRGQARCQRG